MDDYSIKTDNDLFKEYDYFFIDLKYLFDINVELLALDIKLFRVHEIAYVFGGPSEKNVSHTVSILCNLVFSSFNQGIYI
jgi:hypothetical protein